MNFSGNITQILLVVFIALLVFGPKKMMEYAYQVGKMLSQVRRMYEQTMTQVQAEMNEAGVGDAAKLLNTRFDVQAEADKILRGTQPAPSSAIGALNAADAAQESAASNAALTTNQDAMASAWTPEGAARTASTPENAANDAPPSAQPADNTPGMLDKPPTEPGRYNSWLPN